MLWAGLVQEAPELAQSSAWCGPQGRSLQIFRRFFDERLWDAEGHGRGKSPCCCGTTSQQFSKREAWETTKLLPVHGRFTPEIKRVTWRPCAIWKSNTRNFSALLTGLINANRSITTASIFAQAACRRKCQRATCTRNNIKSTNTLLVTDTRALWASPEPMP